MDRQQLQIVRDSIIDSSELLFIVTWAVDPAGAVRDKVRGAWQPDGAVVLRRDARRRHRPQSPGLEPKPESDLMSAIPRENRTFRHPILSFFAHFLPARRVKVVSGPRSGDRTNVVMSSGTDYEFNNSG